MNPKRYRFCETHEATGAWHIRSLPGTTFQLEGVPFRKDQRALCGLLASWDIGCEINEDALATPNGEPGHPCATCKKKYLEASE